MPAPGLPMALDRDVPMPMPGAGRAATDVAAPGAGGCVATSGFGVSAVRSTATGHASTLREGGGEVDRSGSSSSWTSDAVARDRDRDAGLNEATRPEDTRVPGTDAPLLPSGLATKPMPSNCVFGAGQTYKSEKYV